MTRCWRSGRGTGYNAALLSHRLGDQHVFSVDIEPGLVELARQRLDHLGYHPVLIGRDGAEGLAEHAPYDRIIATCSVRTVPWAWVEQTKRDGLILVDVKNGTAGNLVLLRRHADRAEGRFDPRYGSFMPMRHANNAGTAAQAAGGRNRADAVPRRTRLGLWCPWEHTVLWFFAHLHSECELVSYGQVMDQATGQPADVFLVDADGSWCEVAVRSDADGYRDVWQAGPRRLWDDFESAHTQWLELGEPGWERFGLTVSKDGQTVWLDSPAGPRWKLPARLELAH